MPALNLSIGRVAKCFAKCFATCDGITCDGVTCDGVTCHVKALLLTFALVLGFQVTGSGDEPASDAINSVNILKQPWRISRFPELEGRGLRCLAEDHEGNLWFGIRDGVIRYDGYVWQHQGSEDGLPAADVSWLAPRASGDLVAATKYGLFEQDGSRWKRIFPRQSDARVDLSLVIEADDRSLWACSDWGLMHLEDGKSTLYTDDGTLSVAKRSEWFDHVVALPDHCVPSGNNANGINARVVGDTVISFGDDSVAEQAGLKIGDRILAVNGDRQRIASGLNQPPGTPLTLEIQRAASGDRELVTLETVGKQHRSAMTATNSVLVDSLGRVWVGMNRHAVIMSADSGASWTTWDAEQGLDVGYRSFLLESDDGLIYCFSARMTTRVAQFDGKTWTTEELKVFGGNAARSVAVQASDGAIWAGGLETILVGKNGQWTELDTRHLKVPSEGHRMLVASDGALWIGGYDQAVARISLTDSEFTSLDKLRYKCSEDSGASWFLHTKRRELIRSDGDDVQRFGVENGIISRPAAMVAVPNVGVVAVGSHDGVAAVATFDGSSWVRKVFPEIAKTFSLKGVAVTRDGKVWAGAHGIRNSEQVGGLLYGIGDQWQHFRPPYAPKFCSSALEFPDGRMWFTGGFGIVQFDGQQWTKVTDPLLTETGIPSGAIGTDGVAWLATRTKGVLRFEAGQFETLSVDHGLPTNEVTHVYVDETNRLWVGTFDGLFRFDGRQFIRVDLTDLFIAFPIRPDGAGGIWINGRERIGYDPSSPRGKLRKTKLSIQNGGDAFLAWTGVDKWNRTPADQLHWSWRIDQRPWSPFVQRNDTTIRGLEVGDHVVELRCRDADFNVVHLLQKARIAVAPPFWKTAWFIVPAFVSACLLLSLAVRLTLRGMALRKANRDLDQTRQQVAALYAERTAQFKAVCDCSPVGIFVTDQDHNVTYVNPYFARIAGRDADSLMSRGWLDCVHPDDHRRIRDLWDDSRMRPAPVRSSGRFLHKDGEVRHFEFVADRIEQDGEVLGYVGAIDDVTDEVAAHQQIETVNQELRLTLDQLKSAQEMMIQRERLTALGQMAAGVAHDINNSLTPLLTYAELLEEEPGLSSNGKIWAELVRLGVRDTAGTVRRLDHFYRDEHHAHTYERVGIANIVQQTIQLTRPKWQDKAENGGCQIDVVATLLSHPVVQGDASQLRAVLTNLIFNSVDAIEQQGTIEIKVECDDNTAAVEVIDSGSGMTAEQVKRCTDPFYTSKKHGTGLGLSECYGIVRQHRGRLTVQSTLGQGTTVRFEIPVDGSPNDAVAQDDCGSTDQAISHTEDSTSPATVLCIDDDESVRVSTVALLQSRGIDVMTANDGPSGLELMEQQQFQLVLCDQGLPGMDGVSVMKNIKSRWPGVRVVMVSGWSMPNIEGELQPDAVIQKPFTCTAIEDLLSQPSS